ncbi:RING-H2 finger protein ATL81 [Cardamine amara subsp. amara]|uniref:RING-type E3 ubiquitin transferase n=1 Tax=Cardamine amara subsp. amara TaxID=228776 RepID=A0ABD0ZMB3_CARAN
MPTPTTVKPVHRLVSSPVTIVLTGSLLFIIFSGFFSFFYCGGCFRKLMTIWNNHRNRNRPNNLIQPSNPPEYIGLDSKIIQSFPEYPYSFKDYGMDQCSICLTDFMDDDTIRLISTCNHSFHTICIDLWFEAHKTCPVCRRELDVDQTSIEKSAAIPEIDLVRSEIHDDPLSRDTVTIIVHEEHPTTTIGSLEHTDEIESYERRMKASNLRYWRSHSTGHSIVVKTENNEREEEEEKDEIKIHIEISGECQFEDHKRTLPNRKLYCVRGTYSVG